MSEATCLDASRKLLQNSYHGIENSHFGLSKHKVVVRQINVLGIFPRDWQIRLEIFERS
jgi:hypothetical protein